MADSFTPKLNLTKPEIDGSAETWGQKINADLDLLDAHAGSMIAFAASQPTNISNQIQAALTAMFPRGVIMAWCGNINAIPAGWLLCNGLNGTPNLSDRFILGNGGSRGQWESGGAFSTGPTTSGAGGHSHGGAVDAHVLTLEEMPLHQHGGSTTSDGHHTHNVGLWGMSVGAQAGPYGVMSDIFGGRAYGTDGAGGHTHSFATDWRGANWGHNHGIPWAGDHTHTVGVSIVPPYMALAYIMRA